MTDFKDSYAQKSWAAAVAEHTRMQAWLNMPYFAEYAKKRIEELEAKFKQLKS